jgi:hypothetical protein
VHLEITSNSAMLCDEGRVDQFPEVLSVAHFHRAFSGVFVARCLRNNWKFAIRRGSEKKSAGGNAWVCLDAMRQFM